MLFETNKNDSYNLNLDYFNLNKIDIDNSFNNYDKFYEKRDNLNLENGFYLGNIYSDLYKPYKNYKPKKINAYSEQQKMLLKLQELDFIINDLNLYLDIYPNDMKCFEIFKKFTKEYDSLKQNYYDKYQVLELCKDNKNKYTWLDNPWPWDGGYYV
ncbi:MAG: spore coat protein CotJB [Bacilli bacterium]|nr:spore coat protein CotJB [Bacilli bacterium]